MIHFIVLFLFVVVSFLPSVTVAETVLDIQEVKSSQGITAWLVEDHSLPIISVRFSFKGAGAVNTSEEKQGLTRLLSNTLDEGAGELDSQTFQKTLSDNSITLYFSSGRDNFGGELKTLTRNKDKAFNLLKLALTEPRFDSEPLERMRQSNITRIKSNMTDPDWISARVFNDKAYEGHPYRLNSGGTLTSLPRITPADLKSHTQNFLTRDRLMIGVAGDITAIELQKILDDVFGSLPEIGTKNKIEKTTIQNNGHTYLFDKDIPQTLIYSAMPSFSIHDPDYFAARVMNYIFGGSGFGSRLMETAREKEGLTYGIYSGLSHQDYIDSLTVSTSTQNDSVERMLEIIHTEMQNMANTPISEDDLKKTQDYMVGSFPLSLTSTGKISGLLLSLQLNDRPLDYINKYADNIRAVTREDVQRVATRLFTDAKPLIVMVGRPNINEKIEKVGTLPNVE